MDWFPLTVLCAFALASSDAVAKRYLGDYRSHELVLIRFSLSGLLLAPLLLTQPWPHPPPVFWGLMALLAPLEILAMWLYMRAIRDAPLYLTVPYLAFTPVFIVLTGRWVLDERISAAGLLGIGLVAAGAYLLNLDRGRPGGRRSLLAPLQAAVSHSGSRLMLLVAFVYSITAVLGKAAMVYMPPLTFGIFYFVLIGLSSLLVFGAVRPRSVRVLWRRPRWNLAVAALMALMAVTHFLALSRVETAYMVAVKRSSLLFGILYGAWWFAEPGSVRNSLAGLVMVAGVATILLA